MNKSIQYSMYPSVTESVTRMVWKIFQVPKQRRAEVPPERALKLWWDFPAEAGTSDHNPNSVLFHSLCDEFIFRKNKSIVFFPESRHLVEMLWNANMKDLGRVFDLNLPDSFMIAWPKDMVLEGVPLGGCLVSLGKNEQRGADLQEFANTVLGENNIKVVGNGETTFCNITIKIEGDKDSGWARVSMPREKMDAVLKDLEGMHLIPDYDDKIAGNPLDDTQTKSQYVHSRLTIRLMVYMQALRERVIPGFPPGIGARDIGTGMFKDWKPIRILEPETPRGTHATPEMHWRTWHFRQYPVKKDGSRTPGIVFVRDCVVCPEVTPKTVKEV